jgi:hypothetical protein
MADTILHRRSLYSEVQTVVSARPSGSSQVPNPSFAIIPEWSTRLKVTSRGGGTKDCLLLNIKPRVAVTLKPGKPAAMSFDMVGGVLSGPGCESVESAFESLHQEWLSKDREPVSPAHSWKEDIESSESGAPRTIPAVVARISALEPEWRAFLDSFSKNSNTDMAGNFTCRVSSRRNSLLDLNKSSEGSTPTTEHKFYVECYVPIAVRPEGGIPPHPATGSATFPTSFDIYPGVEMITRGTHGVVEPVDFVNNFVSGHKPSRDSRQRYVELSVSDTDDTQKNTRMNQLIVGLTRECSRVGKALTKLSEEGIETAERYAASRNLTVISWNEGMSGNQKMSEAEKITASSATG